MGSLFDSLFYDISSLANSSVDLFSMKLESFSRRNLWHLHIFLAFGTVVQVHNKIMVSVLCEIALLITQIAGGSDRNKIIAVHLSRWRVPPPPIELDKIILLGKEICVKRSKNIYQRTLILYRLRLHSFCVFIFKT